VIELAIARPPRRSSLTITSSSAAPIVAAMIAAMLLSFYMIGVFLFHPGVSQHQGRLGEGPTCLPNLVFRRETTCGFISAVVWWAAYSKANYRKGRAATPKSPDLNAFGRV
jgi:hypothetical protein